MRFEDKYNDGFDAIIMERCPKCEHGYIDRGEVFCSHPFHPMRVGGNGVEWAATCVRFEDTGKIGKLVRTVVRE